MDGDPHLRWVRNLNAAAGGCQRNRNGSGRIARAGSPGSISKGALFQRSRSVAKPAPFFRAAVLALSLACGSCDADTLPFEILEEYPHDPAAYTQGLELRGSSVFESTGLEGRSSVRKVDLRSGQVRSAAPLPADQFGEGLTLMGDSLLQLTWKDGIATVYDTATLTPQRQISYNGEGWGICYDGSSLFMSDGSSVLQRRNPASFTVEGLLTVTMEGRPVTFLNELECVGDHVYANVFMSNTIVKIEMASGRVVEAFDLLDLVLASNRTPTADAVLNGIAYDAADGTFLVTGKLWPKLYRIRLPAD